MATLKDLTQVGGGASSCLQVARCCATQLGTAANPVCYQGVAIGRRSQQYSNSVPPNISIGYQTQMGIYPGGGAAASCCNIGIGHKANYDLRCCAGGSVCGLRNISIGDNAGTQHACSNGMIAIGSGANFSGARRQHVISIGRQAFRGYTTTGQRHINIGRGTYFISCNACTDWINIGYRVNRYKNSTGAKIIVIGFEAATNSNNCVVKVGFRGGTGGNCTTVVGWCASGGYGPTSNKIAITNNCNPWYGAGHTILGNDTHTSAYAVSKWTVPSDCRDKTDIVYLDRTVGLNFVKQLNPVIYNWDRREWYERKCGYEFGQKDGTLTCTEDQFGFLAQEVENTIQQNNLDLQIVGKGLTHFRFNSQSLVPSITLALQELVEKLENYETRVEVLKTN